jgi:hydrogenase expression/formation protein HypE
MAERDERISLAHGEGGRLMRRLIESVIVPAFDNATLQTLGDAACLTLRTKRIAMSTDSYVVSPLFFPGGDIGTLAVNGTVNDLAVAGARPRWISLALIIEEGLPTATLSRVVQSIAQTAAAANVSVVAGDTKVVPKGAADQLFINTTGVGELLSPKVPGPASLEVGDAILVSGPIGRHGVAVLAAREGLRFDPSPQSDCAPLLAAVEALRSNGVPMRAMRDATRGGVAAVLHEWAECCGLTMTIEESHLPITDDVRGVCELLGLDALHVACEGAMVVAVPDEAGEAAIAALRSVGVSAGAQRIGVVAKRRLAPVLIRRVLGREIPIDEPIGALLPRIC